MATNHTTNYSLNLWEPTDKFLRTEFNENSEKIDAALRALEQSKATAATVSALQTSVTNLASQTDTRLTALATQTDAQLKALATQTDTQLKALTTQTSTQLAALATQTDTRLTALDNKSRFTKLKTGSFTAGASSTQIDLTDIDWAAWDKVHLDMVTNNGSQLTVYLNEQGTIANSYIFLIAGHNGSVRQPRMTFYSAFCADRLVCASFGSTAVLREDTLSTLKRLVFIGAMNAGATYTFWGEL